MLPDDFLRHISFLYLLYCIHFVLLFKCRYHRMMVSHVKPLHTKVEQTTQAIDNAEHKMMILENKRKVCIDLLMYNMNCVYLHALLLLYREGGRQGGREGREGGREGEREETE